MHCIVMKRHDRQRRGGAAISMLSIVGMLLIAVSFATVANTDTQSSLTEGQTQTVGSRSLEAVASEQKALGNVPVDPMRIRIPKLGVEAAVQVVTETKDGSMGIPTNYTDVGWYSLGARPGEQGTAVMNGHLDGKNTPIAVFHELEQLSVGDLVEVEDKSGNIWRFTVTGKKHYDYQASTEEVFARDRKARLNLITCGGDWVPNEKTYDERVVVFTELIE